MIGIEWMQLLMTGVLKFVCGFIFIFVVLLIIGGIVSAVKNTGGIKQFLNKIFQKKDPPE